MSEKKMRKGGNKCHFEWDIHLPIQKQHYKK